jgi:ADP-ribose pyrophosphatase YjhB (NUDIX family)
VGKFDNWERGYFTTMYPDADPYDGPRGADVIVYCPTTDALLLLVRGKNPFKGFLVPPSGGVNDGESFRQAAARELEEETGIVISDHQLQVVRDYRYDDFDPRGKLWSRRFLLVLNDEVSVTAGDDAADYRWMKVDEVPFWMLAGDQAVGVRDALIMVGRIPVEPSL